MRFRFEYHLNPRIALLEATQQFHEMIRVISLAGHQMSAAHVHPLYLRKIFAKLALKGFKDFFEIIAR